MIGQTVSHYRIIEQLGAGGMGVVYLAEDTVLGRKVAIKMLNEGNKLGRQHFHTRFLREARAASALSHPHIATIYDYGETPDGKPYIVMEYVKGRMLSDLIHEKSLSLERAIEIITDVAEALGEAHRHGIVHRDIKPSNVAINERGEVKVLDFGLAKHLNDLPNERLDPHTSAMLDTRTREGVIVCTPAYSSPEQALGVEVDARSDLFSLGSVLYECVTGRRAFSGSTDADTRAQVIRDDPLPPSTHNPGITKELDRIALKALSKKADKRYQSAEELARDLRKPESSLHYDNYEMSHTIVKSANTSALHASETRNPSSVTDTLSRPRLSILWIAMTLIPLSAVAFGLWYSLRPTPYKPTPEAQAFYNQGEVAIREGTFFKASKRLQRSVDADTQFAMAHARLSEVWNELDFVDQSQREFIRAQELANRSALIDEDSLRFQAIASTIKRDFARAVEDYRRLVQIVPESERKYAYVDLGRAYEKNEEPPKAIEAYREATKRDPKYATAFLRLGFALRRSQRFDDAHAAFDAAYQYFDLSNEIEGLTEVFYQRGMLFSQQGKVREAKEQLQQALQKSAALENQDQRIRTLLQLSNISITAGEPQQAQYFSQQAISLSQTNGMENLTAAGLIDIGNSYFLLGKYDEAETYFKQALRLATSYKGRRNEARALLSLASLGTHQSKPDDVRQYAERALTLYQQGGYRKETSQAYNILGNAYDQLGNYEAAVKTFKEQLELAEQVDDPQQTASSHEGLGVVLNHQQNYPEALDHFNKQHEIVSKLGIKLVVGYALMNRGTMLWQLGRYDEAEKDLTEARLVANNRGSEPFTELLAWIGVSKAQLELSRKNLPAAKSESRAALKLAGSKFKAIAIQAGYTLGLAQSLSRQTAAGRKNCEEAVVLAKTLPDPLPLSRALLALAEAELESGNLQKALKIGNEAQQRFAEANQLPSEWRAWLIQALAASRGPDNEQTAEFAFKARNTLSLLRESWSSEEYGTYTTRKDISSNIDQLNRLLSR